MLPRILLRMLLAYSPRGGRQRATLVNILGVPSSLNFAVMGGVILLGTLADQQLAGRARARGRE